MSVHDVKEWLENHLIPPYWIEEPDARASILVNITNPMPDSHYVHAIESYLTEEGLPVDETFILPEYQLLYECIWVLRNPLCDKTPLFWWHMNSQEFQVNDHVCLSSLMAITLRYYFHLITFSLAVSHTGLTVNFSTDRSCGLLS